MKKLILAICFVLSIEVASAQVATDMHPEVEKLVNSEEMKSNFDAIKISMGPYILEGKKDEFESDFDKMTSQYLTKFGTILTKNLTQPEAAIFVNEFLNETEESSLPQETLDRLEEQLSILQMEIGMEMNELLLEYVDEAILNDME